MDSPDQNQEEEWLIRTAQNVIAGPYRREQVIQLIEDGELGQKDEVCRSGSYWIYLNERDEVMDQLGIDIMDTTTDPHEEVTEIQTDITLRNQLNQSEDFHSSEPESPSPSNLTSSSQKTPTSSHEPEVFGKFEQTSFWKIAAAILLLISLGIVGAILHLLNTR